MRHRFFGLFPLCLIFLGSAGTSWAQSAAPIIVDHRATRLSDIPESWVEEAKRVLHVAYGHTSHGSQVTDGMTGLVGFKGTLYAWNNGGSGGALDLRDSPFSGASDLGNPNFTAWATATRTYLNAHSDVNVVIWSWCGQVSGATAANISTYLSLMNQLEIDYPNVKFVYMTGHLDGSGATGNLNLRNDQIRTYCRDNNKILYDFADIESYDPDQAVHYMPLLATDACDYDGNGDGNRESNWAIAWQNSHVEGLDWYNCSSAHSQPLNANQKAYAAWALWARLAGWPGVDGSLLSISDASVTEGNSGTTNAVFTVTLDPPTAQTVTVAYETSNGTAAAGSDYTAASGTLTVSPNQTTSSITVPVLGDALVEDDETFYVTLASPVNANLADAQGTGTILNDDTPSVSLSIGDATALEGNAGTVSAVFALQLSAASTQAVTVDYATADQTATAGSDYTATAGSLEFPVGTTERSITVLVNGDTLPEADETFLVNLSHAVGASINDGQGLGTILNDDAVVGEPIVWKNAVGVSVSGNSLTKTGAVGWNAGAVSRKFILSGSGAVEFVVTETNTHRMVGLSNGDTNRSYLDIDFAIFPSANHLLYVFEKGTKRGVFGSYVGGDRLRVAIDAGVVRYFRNDQLLYTSASKPVYPLLVDTSLYSPGATVTSAIMIGGSSLPPVAHAGGPYRWTAGQPIRFDGSRSFDPDGTIAAFSWQFGDSTSETGATPTHAYASAGDYTVTLTVTDNDGVSTSATASVVVQAAMTESNVVWTRAVGVSVSGNNLTKTGAVGWNAGAASTQIVSAGDGYVQFTASETNAHRMAGLSSGDTNWGYGDIDFALYPAVGGVLNVREKGVNRGRFGTYATGDQLRVSVEGGVVRYLRNGQLLYTSTRSPVYPLLVDTSLYTKGATLSNAVLSQP